jgi:hypothetical protein
VWANTYVSSTLLGYNAASSGNPLPTFRDNVSVSSSRGRSPRRKPSDVSRQRIGPIFKGQEVQEDFLTLEDETDTLSRNVGKGLPVDAALYPRRGQISSASRRKAEVAYVSILHKWRLVFSISFLPIF